MALVVGVNVALWLANRMFGYMAKDHGQVFGAILLFDILLFLGFTFLGLLTAWLLAFRPEAFKRSIERSIAKRNSK